MSDYDSNKDFYAMLELKEDADKDQIRKAYKKLALKWHPVKINLIKKIYTKNSHLKFFIKSLRIKTVKIKMRQKKNSKKFQKHIQFYLMM
jgi:curved DNA-binding protein CbpA